MRDFLKYTFASLLALLIFLGMSISSLLFLVILSASRDPVPRVKEKSVLTFNMALDVTDGLQNSANIGQALGNDASSISLKATLDAINQAAKDKRIVALYLHGKVTGGAGYATLKEIRRALQGFRAAGKKIIAYDLDWSERDYYLTSVADTIVLHPFGSLELNGFSSEGTFFAGALQKYGIGVQVTRVGKYKSAVEPFLLTKRSPENRQQTQQLLGDLWSEFATAVEQERKVTPQQLQAIADNNAILEPDEALRQRLITKVGYEDEVFEQLKQLSTEDDNSFRRINLQTYARVAQTELQKKGGSGDKIAIVYAEGDIVDGKGDFDQVGGDRFARLLRKIRQDDDVKAVVLRVNSPGGSAVASDVIQREMILTRKVKPVVVSMGAVAASGGYWISTYSDRIFAEPNTITGSIGVFGLLPNVQELANRNGVTWDSVKTGRFADIQTITRPKTPQELALIQKSVDRIYDQFLNKVAESRKLPRAKVAEIAQGRVWSGKQAKALGLVDELGGLEAALQEAAKRANLGDQWQVEEYPAPPTLAELLFSDSDNQIAKYLEGDDVVLTELRKLRADLAILTTLNDPRGVYARLPINFRID
ncbi:signal peptide protein peptidase SppA, 67K type [Leptolyngbyaceae cyanobacterium JSC-12]|nr:signal peptide protein peptidase SppA, 67K type [Leptolyngbyaceae cyanobacterium JSC-12]